MQLIDTCAEGDGDRDTINKKKLLTYFKANSNYSKYSLEMFISLAQTEALVSEEMAHRLKWGRFVNWHGGIGKNISVDTAQEICNKESKVDKDNFRNFFLFYILLIYLLIIL